jgi:hypothetical protein
VKIHSNDNFYARRPTNTKKPIKISKCPTVSNEYDLEKPQSIRDER